MGRLPQRVEAGIVLRRWLVADAEAQRQAVAESAEHLRPWMAWMAAEPLALENRQAMLARWERDWEAGGDALLGVFVDGTVAGSCGLHRRRGPGTLEIGYWIHASFLRWGLGTKVAAMLTEAAFALPEVAATEIHHDKANTVSARIPRRLGYRFVGESPDLVEAPGEVGVDCAWRLLRSELPALIGDDENGE
jgi:ribosomal-protein-serine acetyltransferase